MNWNISKIINFKTGGLYQDGLAQFGFHDSRGNLYTIHADEGWIGQLEGSRGLKWTAGSAPVDNSPFHVTCELLYPVYVTDTPDGKLLISSAGNNRVYQLDASRWEMTVLIDCNEYGFESLGNCVFDHNGNIWINDVLGCKIWQFTREGKVIQTLGNGQPGFQETACPFEEVQFNWIYDIRTGPDGNIYVLDSKNYAVRMIDVKQRLVLPIAGTGKPGYSGDGGEALKATFGSDPEEEFDGPWSLSLDEAGNIYIGDTHNHVIRMIERATNLISTIAGNPAVRQNERNNPSEADPFKLNLPKICGLDYDKGKLYIPEWDGDLIVLAKEVNG